MVSWRETGLWRFLYFAPSDSLGRGFLLNAIIFNWIVVIICSFTLKFLVNQLGNGVGFKRRSHSFMYNQLGNLLLLVVWNFLNVIDDL